MNAITSRLDALRARKRAGEESRKRIRISSSSAGGSLSSKEKPTSQSKPLSPPASRDSLIEQHQEPGTQRLPFKVKANNNSNSNSNSSKAETQAQSEEQPPPISPDELANAKRRIAELERILNGLDAQLERTQEDLEEAREAADNSREAVQVAAATVSSATSTTITTDDYSNGKPKDEDKDKDATDQHQLATIHDLNEEKARLQTEMQMAVDNAGSARRQLDKIQQENLEFQQMLGTEVVDKFREMQKIITLLQKEKNGLIETDKEAVGEDLAEQIRYLEEKGMQLRTRLDEREDDLECANDRIAVFEKEKADSQVLHDDRIVANVDMQAQNENQNAIQIVPQPKQDSDDNNDQVEFLQELIASLGKKLQETQQELTSTKSKLEETTQLGVKDTAVGMEHNNISRQIPSADQVEEMDQSRSSESFPSSPQESEPAENDRMDDATQNELEETREDLSLARRRLREAQEEIGQLKSLETKIISLEKESDWTEQKLRNESIFFEHEAQEAKEEWGKAVKEIALLKKASDKAELSTQGTENVIFVEDTLPFVRNELKTTQEELRLALQQVKEAKEELEKVKPLEEKVKTFKLEMEAIDFELEETSNRGTDLQAAEMGEVKNMEFVQERVAILTEQLKEAGAEAEHAKTLLNEANQELLRLKPFESQSTDIEFQQATSFDAMEQMRGNSANRKVVALRNELEELRNELEEAQDDAQDAQKRLEEANAEMDQLKLKQDLEQRFPAVDNETNVNEQIFRTQLAQTERDLDEVRDELSKALTKIHILGMQSEEAQSQTLETQHQLNTVTSEQVKLSTPQDQGPNTTEQILRNELVETRCEIEEILERLHEATSKLQEKELQSSSAIEAEADGKATEREGALTKTAKETGAEQETGAVGQSEEFKREAMINAELTTNPDVLSQYSGEDDMSDECTPEEEDDEIASPRRSRVISDLSIQSTMNDLSAQGLGGFLMSSEEARQHELIQELKLLRLEEETVMSGADEEEESESQQKLMDETQRESLHDSVVDPYERRPYRASNLSHKVEYTQERFHALKEEIKDLRHTVQNLQQKISLSEDLDLIKSDRDEAATASKHVLEGCDSSPNLEATRETFGQFKEESKELRLQIQGLESGKSTITQGVEDDRTAREVAEKETARVKASLVTCQRNLKEANEYFAVLLDRNKQLQADKRRFLLELASDGGAGAVRSIPKKEKGLDSQDLGLGMEGVALESSFPGAPGNDIERDLEYVENLAEEMEASLPLHDHSLNQARQAFGALHNELDGLRKKIQNLAAEKYQIGQERDTAKQACWDTKKRAEELEAAISMHKKNLSEAHSYFHELKEKNSSVQNAIQRVESEKIILSEETTAAKKQCAQGEARQDQIEESLWNIQRNQEDALQSFSLLRQRNKNLEEENECLVHERDAAIHTLETMAKALTTYRQNLEEAHSCFESLRVGNEELKDERDATNTARGEAETRADLLAQTLSTVRNNLDEAHGAFRDIQNQNEDLRFKIQIFHEERQIIDDAGDGKFPLLQLIATLKEEISSLKTGIAKGEIREREMQAAMTGHQTNLEEARARFGTLQSEIEELRTKNTALKGLDMEILQTKVKELRIQNQEFEEAQNELETKLNSMETTSAWKLHTNEVMLSQKLDTAVREQRLLEERLYKIQVSHEELQTTASRLDTEKRAVEKKKNSLQDTVGMQGYELLNIRKQLDGIEGFDKSSKDRIEFLKEQLEEVCDRWTREIR